MTRILIHGGGRMGQALQRLSFEADSGCDVVAAVSRTVELRVRDGVPQFAASELGAVPAFDVAIDFSLPDGFDAVLAVCRARRVPLVSGTTGLSPGQLAALDAAAAEIPLCWSSNFSLGAAILHELVQRAAARLPGWDCDIVETHHRRKQDAPSGTALTLGQAAKDGGASPRYASIRAGDVIGDHVVQFTGPGERLELTHRATNRDIFARGALHAARSLVGKPPGRYQVVDLL